VKDFGEGGSDAGKSDRTSELLHEATQLLKTLRELAADGNPKLKVMQIGDLSRTENDMVLKDSGATHALRRAADLEEWEKGQRVTVQLAEGTTDTLRLKHSTKILLHPTSTSWIVPWLTLTSHWFGLTNNAVSKMVRADKSMSQ